MSDQDTKTTYEQIQDICVESYRLATVVDRIITTDPDASAYRADLRACKKSLYNASESAGYALQEYGEEDSK